MLSPILLQEYPRQSSPWAGLVSVLNRTLEMPSKFCLLVKCSRNPSTSPKLLRKGQQRSHSIVPFHTVQVTTQKTPLRTQSGCFAELHTKPATKLTNLPGLLVPANKITHGCAWIESCGEASNFFTFFQLFWADTWVCMSAPCVYLCANILPPSTPLG